MNAERRPPHLAARLLARALPAGPAREGLMGDLEELHARRAASGGRLAADLWYWREALGAALRYRALPRDRGRRARGPARSRLRRPGLAHEAGELALELRGAWRRLCRSPGFAAAATVTLALGIGTSTAVLAVVYGVLLRPLPYPEADRLVVIEHELPGFAMAGERTATIGGLYAALAQYLEHSRSFEEIGGFAGFDAALVGEGDPQFLRMATATSGFFRALGLPPLHGRLLADEDPAPDAEVRGSSLLSHELWVDRFGRDPDVLGRVLGAQGFENEIVGVLPSALKFPPDRVSLWGSLPNSRLREKPDWAFTLILGRLAPGVTADQARDELDRLIPELPDHFGAAQVRRAVVDGRMRAKVTPLHAWLVGGVERPLWLLLAAVGLVLAIACGNVTNLVLVRTEARRRELAVRTAVGASRRDLARAFVADSLVLTTFAGMAGAALAVVGVTALQRFFPSSLPRLEAVEAGWRVAVFGALPVVGCAILFAIVPWLAARRFAGRLSGEGRLATTGRARLRARYGLVVLQFAMAVVLMVGAGLLVRSFLALSRVDLGFDPRGVLSFRIVFPFQEIQAAGPDAEGPATRFYDRLAERVAALPGVEAVGYGSCVPLSESCGVGGLSLRREDRPDTGGSLPATLFVQGSPGYLEALRIPLLQGRALEPRDHEQRTNAVVLSAEAARVFFPGEDPLGRRLVQDGREWTPFTVVGVAGDAQHEDPREAPGPFAYLPVLGDFSQYERWAVSFVVRAAGEPESLVAPIRHEVAALRPDIPVAYVETLSDLAARSTARLRFSLWLLALAAATALALSAIGAYGVMAYVVALRRHELGIRLALGADGGKLRSMVLLRGVATAGAGLLLGLGGAALAGRLLGALLFEIDPGDPLTYAAASCALAATALVAAYVPARRASRVDPVEILRGE